MKFARRTESVHRSFIREILAVTEDPNIISFAGGLPNPRFFPVEEFQQSAHNVLVSSGREALQYSTTEGYRPLREFVSDRYKKNKGIDVDPDEILITNGSQQGIDLIAKILLNPGDGVVLENPSYLAAIQSFSFYEPTYFPVSLEEDGVCIGELEQALQQKNVRFFYSIPNFQNPSGISYSEEKRTLVVQQCDKQGVFLVEDDPYGEIRFDEGKRFTSFRSYSENVILLGSFSKIVAPGCRLGWIAAKKEILEKVYIAKQASDLHSNFFTQRVVADFLQHNDVDAHIARISHYYGAQKTAMISALQKYFPSEVQYTNPKGGMFLWMTLPEKMDAYSFFSLALEKKVAFVPGESFFTKQSKKNTLRLNFSNSDPERIEEGIRRMAEVYARMREQNHAL